MATSPAAPHPPSIWVGHLAFGLVQLPVQLHRAAAPARVPLHEVHRADGGRVRRRRWCTVCGRDVADHEVARGWEHHGHQVVLTDADLEQLPLPSQRVLDLQGVIPAAAVDPLAYAGAAYYIAPRPGPAAAKPFILLRDVLAERGEAGIVRVTIGREHPAAVRPRGALLVLDLLHWPDEVRPPPRRAPPPTAPGGTAERELMSRLVRAMSRPVPDVLADQRDTYGSALQQLAAAKAVAAPLLPAPEAPAGTSGVVALVDALNASLARTRAGDGGTGDR